MMVTLVLFRPLIVMDVHRPIPVKSCCSCISLGEMKGVENIATPPGLCTLFHGTDDIAVVNLLLFQFFFNLLNLFFCFWMIQVCVGFC